jgi:diguanylate cyclase
LNDHFKDYKEWLEKTDQGLYKSKEGGRNRYTFMD